MSRWTPKKPDQPKARLANRHLMELAVDAEDISGRRMQRSVGDETIDGVAALETGIDADQRLRPEPVVGVKLLDLLLDVGGADQGE